MRYHPIVFATKANVPFVCISYEHKVKGFISKIGLTDLIVDVEEISADKIIDRFTFLEDNYKVIKEQLRKQSPQLKEDSKKTTRIIIEKLNCQTTSNSKYVK